MKEGANDVAYGQRKNGEERGNSEAKYYRYV